MGNAFLRARQIEPIGALLPTPTRGRCPTSVAMAKYVEVLERHLVKE
jgi:hypothetical protein